MVTYILLELCCKFLQSSIVDVALSHLDLDLKRPGWANSSRFRLDQSGYRSGPRGLTPTGTALAIIYHTLVKDFSLEG